MEFSLLIALPVIILLGIISSYHDIVHSTIKNRLIIFALIYACIVIASSIVEPSGRPLQTLFHLVLVAIISISIWYANFWSAGDAKLFIAYAALIPLSTYTNATFGFFGAFDILINTFVPVFAFYCLLILIRIRKSTFHALFQGVSSLRVLSTMLFVLGFSWLLYRLLPFFLSPFGIQNNIFLSTIFLLIMSLIFHSKDNSKERSVAFALCLGALLDFKVTLGLPFLSHMVLSCVLYLFLRYVLLYFSYYANSTPIFIENLKPGMMVAENFRNIDGSYEKVRMLHSDFISNFLQKNDKNMVLINTAGLENHEIEKINRLHSNGDIKEHTIRIYKTLPFAPFIFMGVLITIVSQGSLFLRFF